MLNGIDYASNMPHIVECKLTQGASSNMTKGKANGTATVADPAAASRRRAGAAQREDKPTIPARPPRLRRAPVAAARADDQPEHNTGTTRPARHPRAPQPTPPGREGAGAASRAAQSELALPRV